MRLHAWRCRPIALAVLASASVASAQARDPVAAVVPYAQTFTTRHASFFNGQKVSYLVTVGPTILRDASGQPTINIVSTAYVRSDVQDRVSCLRYLCYRI